MSSHWIGRKHRPETIKKLQRTDVRDALEEIKVLYLSGWTTRQLGKKFHCEHSFVGRLLRESGVEMRPPFKRKEVPPWNKGKAYPQILGEKNPRWKGGITCLNQVVRHCLEYKQWRTAVFKRDEFTCQFCKQKGGTLEADHFPKRFAEIMTENKISSYEDAQKCSELWSMKNGRTLCRPCHNITKKATSSVAR